jgi:hypothetical protein
MGMQGVGGGVEGVERDWPAPADAHESTLFAAESRVRELEAENARLKSLVGELLVANQLLREQRSGDRDQ